MKCASGGPLKHTLHDAQRFMIFSCSKLKATFFSMIPYHHWMAKTSTQIFWPRNHHRQKYQKMGGSWARCSICCKKSPEIAANCCNCWMEASINFMLSRSIFTVLTHLLINFECFEATKRLCSNLPKFAATPEVTQICHFEAKWQLTNDKNKLE